MLRDETGDLYESSQATAFWDRLGQPEDRSNQQLRRFARENWVAVRGHGQGGAKRYLAIDVAAAIALSAVQASGIADRQIMKLAADALYQWQPEQESQEYLPITGALYGVMRNQMWVLAIRVSADRAGNRVVRAFCYDSGGDQPRIPDNSVSALHINLSWLLVPLAMQVCRAMGARTDA